MPYRSYQRRSRQSETDHPNAALAIAQTLNHTKGSHRWPRSPTHGTFGGSMPVPLA